MMATRQVLSPAVLARLSSSSLQSSIPPLFRFLSSSSGGGGEESSGDDKGDPFGVHFEDGEEKLGPELPPKYVRDVATGKVTEQIVKELTDEEQHLLSLDDIEQDRLVVERLMKEWRGEKDAVGDSVRQGIVADRIREEETALNTFGRSGDAIAPRESEEDDGEAYHDERGYSQPLSPEEFESLSRFLKQEHNVQIDESDVPLAQPRAAEGTTSADNPDLDLRWLTSAAQREMDDSSDNDPFMDLMPHDLNPARLVNRKKAKPIPKELIHHNNLSLLRRYVTPGGQIMNRVQSRLGAKDQRKIAKMVKRARALGLIPYIGQWKVENHGNIYEKDIHQDKDWELELKRRGLVISKERHD